MSSNQVVGQLAGFTGILNDTNTRTILRALEKIKGIETLGEPEVVTTSGRQAQMRATHVVTVITNMIFVENLTTRTNSLVPQGGVVETGPVFDVVPYVLSDGYTLDLTMIGSSLEFWGYATIPTNTAPQVATNSVGETFELPAIWPALQLSRSLSHVSLYDNQTAILSLNNPEQVRFATPDKKREAIVAKHIRDGQKNVEKEILVFVTATIVDPAGNRVHAEGKLPFAQDKIPPQPLPSK